MPCRPCIHFDGVSLRSVKRGQNGQIGYFAEDENRACLQWLIDAAYGIGVKISRNRRSSLLPELQ